MAKPFDETKHLDAIAYLTETDYTGGAYEQTDPKDPPDTSKVWSARDAWWYVGYQAHGISEDLKSALDRLLDEQSGWRGPAADAYREKVTDVVKFIAKYAHVCNSNNDAPAEEGGENNEPDTGGFGNGTTDGKSFYQALDAAHGAISTARGAIEPPPWWDHPMGVRGGGSNTMFYDDDPWYDIAVRPDGAEQGDGDADAYPTFAPTGSGGRYTGDQVPKDTFEGWYTDAGVNTDDNDNTADHKFPTTDNEAQKLFLYLELNSNEEGNTKEAGNNLADAYEDLAFAQPPKAPDLGVEDGDGNGGGGGFGGGGGGTPTMPDTPTTDPPPDMDPPPDTDQPPYDPPPDPDQPPYDPPPDPDQPPYDPPPDPDQPPYDPPPDSDYEPPPNSDYDPPPGSEYEPPPGTEWDPDGGSTSGGIPDTDTDLSRAGGGSGGGSGPFNGGPFGSGAGSTAGSGASGPGGLGTNPAGGAGGGAGAGPAGAGVGGAGAGAGAGRGMGGMMAPMMGGGGQQGEGEEQDRNTWLDEDDDVWGADEDGAPPVIGGSF